MIGMVLIVAQHFQSERVFEHDEKDYPKHLFNETLMNCMAAGGKVGVNIFLLLSGYFFKDQGMKPASLLRTWIQTVNWSHIIFFVEWIRRPMWWGDFQKGLFPVYSSSYWYVSSYLGAMMLSPGIALAAKKSSGSQLLSMILSLFAVMCLFPWGTYTAYCNIQWFTFVSLIGSAIRRFEPRLAKISTFKLKVALMLLLAINYGSVVYFTATPSSEYARSHGGPGALTRENNSKLALYIGIVAFLLALRVETYSDTINQVSSCTFGVYLIHENPFLKSDIWNTLVDTRRYQNHVLFPVHALTSVTAVYMGCSLLEYLRQKLFGSLEHSIANFLLNFLAWIQNKLVDPALNNEKSIQLPKVDV